MGMKEFEEQMKQQRKLRNEIVSFFKGKGFDLWGNIGGIKRCHLTFGKGIFKK